MKADLVLSRRLGGEGEAALRAILTGQEVLEKAASSEHREAGCLQERNSGVSQVETLTSHDKGRV